MPPPLHDCFRITYADYVAQILTTPYKKKHWMAHHRAQEITKLNNYEKQWKIQTNQTKFKVLPLAQVKPEDLMAENRLQPYSYAASMLGLLVGRKDNVRHVTTRTAMARISLWKLS